MILKPNRITTPNPGNDIYLAPVADRLYRIPHSWRLEAYTDCGRVDIAVAPGFLYNSRSGPMLVDLAVPHIGTMAEAKEWLGHDLGGHGVGLTFEEVNDALRMGLRDNCAYSREKAGAVHVAVSASDNWFGTPELGDMSYPNLALIKVRHYDK